MSPKSLLLSLLLIASLYSCSSNRLDVDTSRMSTEIEYVHLDSLFVNTSPDDLSLLNQRCKSEFGELFAYEIGYCLKFPNDADSSFRKGIGLFLSDPYIQRLERRMQEIYKDVSFVKKEIDNGFKHLKFYFPNLKMPKKVVFMNSLFTSSVFSGHEQIGIGLERYLGVNEDVIRELPNHTFPEWEKKAMDAQYISRDPIVSWISTHLVKEVDGNLVEKMIRWGKILYLTQAAFPEKKPPLILRYPSEDYQWALDNEYTLWKYLAEEKMLFKSDELTTKNMLGEGPFTPGLPEKGPDRLGQFLGYRMVLKYMEIESVTLQELVNASYSDILMQYEID